MIKIKYTGRLGNNMFQRGVAEIFSKKYNIKVLDSENMKDQNGEPRHIEKIINPNQIKKRIKYENPLILNDELLFCKTAFMKILEDPPSPIFVDGFFQKSWIFLDYRNFFRNLYKLPEVNLSPGNDDVAICIRRDDMLDSKQKNNIIPFEYYEHVLKKYFPDKTIHLFTDGIHDEDIQRIIKIFNIKNLYYDTEHPIMDLSRLSKFKNIVTGNSTFHWWGVFLGNPQNVYSPLHSSGWGITNGGGSKASIDLFLPFVNYIHYSKYMC